MWLCLYILLTLLPVAIEPAANKAVAIGTGSYYAITPQGTLVGWGSTTQKFMPYSSGLIPYPYLLRRTILRNVDSIYTNRYNTVMAIDQDGVLWGWGRYGSLLLAEGTGMFNRPVKIMEKVTSVAMGKDHVAAIRTDGTLWVWGGNWDGQLGLGFADSNTHEPQKIMEDIIFVYGDYNRTLAVDKDNKLYTWGGYSELEHAPLYSPACVASGIASILSGDRNGAGSYLALTTEGDVLPINIYSDKEENAYSRLGSPVASNIQTLTEGGCITNDGVYVPLGVFVDERMEQLIQKVSVAYLDDEHHSLVVTTDGKLYAEPGPKWLPVLPHSMNTLSPVLRNSMVVFLLLDLLYRAKRKSAHATA